MRTSACTTFLNEGGGRSVDTDLVRDTDWQERNPVPPALGDKWAFFTGVVTGKWQETLTYECERFDHLHSGEDRLDDPLNPDGVWQTLGRSSAYIELLGDYYERSRHEHQALTECEESRAQPCA